MFTFATGLILRILRGKFARLAGLALACAAPSLAQVVFTGAQSTVPATGLSAPFAATVDSSGNVYIADAANNRVVKIDAHGTQTVVSVAPLTVNDPTGVGLDRAGNLFISDTGNNRVVKVPAGGGSATAFAAVVTPGGLAVDGSGNVFVPDNEDGKIVKITSGGAKSDFETGLTDPLAVAVDASGNVYLADGSLTSIEEYPAAGGAGSDVGSSLIDINGVAVDGAGNVYVAESGEGAAIIEITTGGPQLTLAASGLGTADYLAVDANYNLFIPDDTNNDVIEFATKSVNLGFAHVCVDGAPAPCSQTAILNFAALDDAISSVSVVTTGDASLDFSTSGGTCSGETSPCTVTVVFTPTEPGMRTGAVLLGDANLEQEVSFPVYGTGLAADAGFSPALTSPPFGTDGFQDPIAVAVAGAGVLSGGPIFIADDDACVIWILSEGEDFTIYAGTYGSCGYSGDGGTATSATLNSPEDVALDGAGNVYIADAGNAVVRKVDRNGNISTVAGNNGAGAGFSGDGGAATSAQLNSPDGVALDSAGNLYIADADNDRIRKVDLGGTITTVAGTGTPGYTGDGGAATSAKLDFPVGVRADTAGDIFIADANNNVIRKIDLTGTISTVAGNFAMGSGYSGDGGAATSAQLNSPDYVSVDAAGELFISDNGNGVVRRVDGMGKITTFMVPTDFPVDFVVDPTGNFAMIDPEDEALTLMVRSIPSELDFGSQNVNTSSVAQDVTVTNMGNQALDFSAIAPPTGFNTSGADTSCSTESALSIGLDCVLGIKFDPPTGGGYETDVAVTDNSLGPAGSTTQDIPVTGTGVVPLTATTTALTAAPNPAFAGQTVTLTATVTPTPTGGALGSVDFCLGGAGPGVVMHSRRTPQRSFQQWKAGAFKTSDGVNTCGAGTLLETVSVGADGKAVLMLTTLPVGADSITAVYSGNGTLDVSTSDPVTETINALTTTTTGLTMAPNPGADGQTVTLTGSVTPAPTGSPLGSITFCDAGNPDAILRRFGAQPATRPRRHASAIRRNGDAGPCGLDTALGTVNITSGASAMLALTTLTVGDHSIYAVYSGNAGFEGSTSDPVTETINTAYTVTAPQTPFDVAEGGSVQITVTVPPLGGAFNNVVTLVATGLPRGATATFNPPTVTPGANGAQSVMTIQLAPLTARTAPPIPSWPVWPTAAAGMLLFAWRLRKRPLPRLAFAALVLCAVSAAAQMLGGCAGGFAGLSTPPGQYTVTVSGTSGGLSASTTVTVVVQP